MIRATNIAFILLAITVACHIGLPPATALSIVPARKSSTRHHSPENVAVHRRDVISSILVGCATAISSSICIVPTATNAAEDNRVLTDEEMAAKIARKMELLRASSQGASSQPNVRATEIRSDINPKAAANLRSRSAVENARIAMEKQKELKSRDKAKMRDDLCEMLGRGC